MNAYHYRLKNGEIGKIYADTLDSAIDIAKSKFGDDLDYFEDSYPLEHEFDVYLENGDWRSIIADDIDDALDSAIKIYGDAVSQIVDVETNTAIVNDNALHYSIDKNSALKPAFEVKNEPYEVGDISYQLPGAKSDACKYRPSLCTLEPLVRAISEVREFGLAKYKEAEDWRSIEPQRWREALIRHAIAENDDPGGLDAESGLPHTWHIACNIMFLIANEDS